MLDDSKCDFTIIGRRKTWNEESNGSHIPQNVSPEVWESLLFVLVAKKYFHSSTVRVKNQSYQDFSGMEVKSDQRFADAPFIPLRNRALHLSCSLRERAGQDNTQWSSNLRSPNSTSQLLSRISWQSKRKITTAPLAGWWVSLTSICIALQVTDFDVCIGSATFTAMGIYSYASGMRQLRERELEILRSGTKFGLGARKTSIYVLSATLVGLGAYRLINWDLLERTWLWHSASRNEHRTRILQTQVEQVSPELTPHAFCPRRTREE